MLTEARAIWRADRRPVQAVADRPLNIIWDDDCGSDLDCVYSLSAIHALIRRGDVRVLALILDSPNPYGAPVFRTWSSLWKNRAIPIGVYRGSTGAQGADSAWSRAIRDAFQPGDTSARYPDCVSTYRRALSRAADRSVRVVETGFPTCLVALMRSAPDGISPMSGADLVRAKVQGLYLMGGDYPGPATEFNFKTAAVETAFLFRNWRAAEGYPPIFLTGFTLGIHASLGLSGCPRSTIAVRLAEKVAGENSRPVWDLMSIDQAVVGTSAYLVSPDGENDVDATTGRNHWIATTPAGHRYMIARDKFDYRTSLAALCDGSRR